jgi:hypothetical protein
MKSTVLTLMKLLAFSGVWGYHHLHNTTPMYKNTFGNIGTILYNGKLSREKSFVNWQKWRFREENFSKTFLPGCGHWHCAWGCMQVVTADGEIKNSLMKTSLQMSIYTIETIIGGYHVYWAIWEATAHASKYARYVLRATPQKICGETFVALHKSEKFTKVFSLKNFPLYGTRKELTISSASDYPTLARSLSSASYNYYKSFLVTMV